jgi:hypothetical protein
MMMGLLFESIKNEWQSFAQVLPRLIIVIVLFSVLLIIGKLTGFYKPIGIVFDSY